MNSKSTKKVDNICAISPLQVAKIYLNISKKYVTIFNSELLRVFFTHLLCNSPDCLYVNVENRIKAIKPAFCTYKRFYL